MSMYGKNHYNIYILYFIFCLTDEETGALGDEALLHT